MKLLFKVSVLPEQLSSVSQVFVVLGSNHYLKLDFIIIILIKYCYINNKLIQIIICLNNTVVTNHYQELI